MVFPSRPTYRKLHSTRSSTFGSTIQASPLGSTTPQSQSAFGSNTPFGGSAQPAFGASSTPAFGSTTTPAFGATTTPFGSTPFGSTTPGFGVSNNASVFGCGAAQPAFGACSTPAFGSTTTPAFGATTTPFGSTPFGSTTPGFGVSNNASAFGCGAAQPAFGVSSTPAFGSTITPAFGASTTPFGSTAFGSTTPGFGVSNNASVFGCGAAQPAFGASSTPAFGSTITPAFGASTTPFGSTAFGSTTPGFGVSNNAPVLAFGSSNASVFGQNTAPSFGSCSSTPAFGSSSATGFGNASSAPACGGPNPSPATPSFSFSSGTGSGQSTSPFGNSNPFGSTSIPSFGGQISSFGVQTTTPAFGNAFGQPALGGQSGGSRVAPYTPQTEADAPGSSGQAGKLESISAMPVYKDKSHEELRLEDYHLGDKGGCAPLIAPSAGTGFGASVTPSIGQSSNPFSTSTSPTPFSAKPHPTFPSQSSNPFQPASSFGVLSASTFASSSSPSPFGMSTQSAFSSTPSLFASTTSASTVSPFGSSLNVSKPQGGAFQSTTQSLGQIGSPAFGETAFGNSFGQSALGGGSRVAPHVQDGSSSMSNQLPSTLLAFENATNLLKSILSSEISGSADLHKERKILKDYLGNFSLEAINEANAFAEIERVSSLLLKDSSNSIERAILKHLVTLLASFKEIVPDTKSRIEAVRAQMIHLSRKKKDVRARLHLGQEQLSSLQAGFSNILQEERNVLGKQKENLLSRKKMVLLELVKTSEKVLKDVEEWRDIIKEDEVAAENWIQAREKLAHANLDWQLCKQPLEGCDQFGSN